MPYELDSEIRSRLIRHYQQVSDQELFEAAGDAEDLTPTAQEVVRAELQTRGLADACVDPKDQPVATTIAEERDRFGFARTTSAGNPFRISQQEPLPRPAFGAPIEKGRIALITLYDAIEAGRACDLLDESGIDLDVKDLSQTEGRGTFYGGGPIALQLIVNEQDRDRAVSLLRDKMGLFPLEEIAEPDSMEDDGTVATVGQFGRRTDAEDVTRVLTDAKIWNRITANPDGSPETEDAFLVEVREVDLAGAGELVEKALNLPEA